VNVSQGADINSIREQCKDVTTPCWGFDSDGSDCSSDWSSCQVMARIQANPDKTTFNFALIGMKLEPDMYVALGIAENGQRMVDTLMVVCSSDNSKTVGLYWGQKSSRPKSLGTSAAYFKSPSNKYDSGNILCEFEMPSEFTSEKSFHLATKNYAILLAKGNYKGNSLTQHAGANRRRTEPSSLIKKAPTAPGEPTPSEKTPTSEDKSSAITSSSSHLVASYLAVLSLLWFKIWLV